jgi:hypothetical protein
MEFVAFTGSQRADVSIDADLVFVGYGIEAPERNATTKVSRRLSEKSRYVG